MLISLARSSSSSPALLFFLWPKGKKNEWLPAMFARYLLSHLGLKVSEVPPKGPEPKGKAIGPIDEREREIRYLSCLLVSRHARDHPTYNNPSIALIYMNMTPVISS